MSKTPKKRNKKFTQKIKCNPLGIRNMKPLMDVVNRAVEKVDTGVTVGDMDTIITFSVMLKRLYASESASKSALDTAIAIKERLETQNVPVIVPAHDEATAIKTGITELMEFINAQSNFNIINIATQMLGEMKRNGGRVVYDNP